VTATEKTQFITPKIDDNALAPRQPQNGSQLPIEPEIKVEPEKMGATADATAIDETVVNETVAEEARPAAELLPNQPPSAVRPTLRKGLRFGLRPGM